MTRERPPRGPARGCAIACLAMLPVYAVALVLWWRWC